MNSLIGYIISNFIFKNPKIQEKMTEKIQESREKKKNDIELD
jgi:hypothetical protein